VCPIAFYPIEHWLEELYRVTGEARTCEGEHIGSRIKKDLRGVICVFDKYGFGLHSHKNSKKL
jgi:hypothetical protein